MIRYFFDCIFYTIFRWMTFLKSNFLPIGVDYSINLMDIVLYITILFSLNLHFILWGISVLNGFSLASYSTVEIIISYILAYEFCYYIYIYNKRYIVLVWTFCCSSLSEVISIRIFQFFMLCLQHT